MTVAKRLKGGIKPAVFLLALLPFVSLMYNFATDNLSANPLDDITDTTGTWTLRFLLITLAVTPLRKITGWSFIAQLRRMIGLFAFFYVCMHFTTYIWLDKFFEWDEMVKDVAKRPFITAGFTSFVLMIPLAITSWNRMVKWMGGKRWKMLHRLVYATAVGGVIHYLWLVKADKQRPLIYGALLAIVLGYRLWDFLRQRLVPTRSLVSQDLQVEIIENVGNS